MAIAQTYNQSRVEEIRTYLQSGKLSAGDAKLLLANPALAIEAYLKLSSSPYQPASSETELPFAFSFTRYRNFKAPIDFGSPDSVKNPSLILPVTPEEVTISLSNSATTVTTIAGRTFTHAAGRDLEKISFSAFFPHNFGYEDKGLITPGFDPVKMGNPGLLADKFRRAMQANQPFIFAVNKIKPDFDMANVVVVPMEMTIVNFQRTVKAGHGNDIFYEMELQRWYPQDGHVAPPPRTYVTKKGDTIATIALRELKKASRWKEIRTLNLSGTYGLLYPPVGPGSTAIKLNTPVLSGVTLILPRK